MIDDALERYDLAPEVVVGGVSMGGDIAIALAGIDARVARVSAMVATPDWTRPGMTLINEPSTVLDQGTPSKLGQWYYEALDPMSHLERYVGRPVISFDLAGEDRHVPPSNALAFRDALISFDASAAKRVTVRLHDGLDHMAGGRDPGATVAALDALAASC